MYQIPRPTISPRITISRMVKNTGLKYVAFSADGYASCVHGNTELRPATSVSRKNTNATGKNATYPSMNRITWRDQRAVVIRWTATNVTPACESAVKNNQFAWNARHARSGARNTPAIKITAPIANSASSAVLRDFGISLLDAASTSLADGVRTGCRLTAGGRRPSRVAGGAGRA